MCDEKAFFNLCFIKNAIAATFKYPKIKLAGKSMARTIT